MCHEPDMRWVVGQLETRYGRPERPSPKPVLEGLIATILSQNTTGATARQAFAELSRRFPAWEDLPAADTDRLADAIRVAGLAETRARRLQAIVSLVIEEFGEASLEVLRDWPDDAVVRYLTGFEGVGPKTAACVLLFAMARDVFPVDTHVWRICRRLGWVPDSSSRNATFDALAEEVPPDLRHGLHVLLIRLGREVCRAHAPRCDDCPLAARCPSAGVSGS